MSEIDVSNCKFRHISNMNNWLCASNEFDISREPYCNNNKNCMYKQLQQLIAENEELKHKVNLMMDCENCKVDDYKHALDKIEHICNDSYCDNTVCTSCSYNNIDCDLVRRKAVLQKIKEVNGNE